VEDSLLVKCSQPKRKYLMQLTEYEGGYCVFTHCNFRLQCILQTIHYLPVTFFGASMNVFMVNVNLTAVRPVLRLELKTHCH
jgi:hypothetical protein